MVKNGSKILSSMSAGMPAPLSCTSTKTVSDSPRRVRTVTSPSGGARVDCICNEIHDHLGNLSSIGIDEIQVGQIRDEFDAVSGTWGHEG